MLRADGVMGIVLGPGDGPVISAHEATALALYLAALGMAADRSLAGKLQARAPDAASGLVTRVELTGEERRALLGAIAEFPPERMPQRIREIRDSLSES
jgi:hypothetical protein